MNTPYDSPILDATMNALSNQKRRGIMHDLSLSPTTVSRLAKNHALSLPAIHKHMISLENANLIIKKKIGRTNYVTLNLTTLGVLKNWIVQYHTGWGNEYATLENYISRMKE